MNTGSEDEDVVAARCGDERDDRPVFEAHGKRGRGRAIASHDDQTHAS